MSDRQIDHDLYRGALGIAVLALLDKSEDHGFGLAQRMVKQSGGALEMSQGNIYPLLHKLESQGYVSSRWQRSENNRRAKYYSITPKGRTWLVSRTKQWRVLSDALSGILNLISAEPARGV